MFEAIMQIYMEAIRIVTCQPRPCGSYEDRWRQI